MVRVRRQRLFAAVFHVRIFGSRARLLNKLICSVVVREILVKQATVLAFLDRSLSVPAHRPLVYRSLFRLVYIVEQVRLLETAHMLTLRLAYHRLERVKAHLVWCSQLLHMLERQVLFFVLFLGVIGLHALGRACS